jgi:hypothetical protein
MEPAGNDRLIFETLEEAYERSEEERSERLKKGRWGAWHLCNRRKWLCINRGYPYELELSADSPLKLFHHLRDKTWLQRGDLEDLLAAFNDIFGYSWLENEIYEKTTGNLFPV